MPIPIEIYRKAQRHLSRRDAVLKKLIAGIGPCTLYYEPDRFRALVRSIIAQQISTKAANSIRGRVEAALGRKGITPQAILRATPEALCAAGLSAAKERSLRDLAEKVHCGAVPLDQLHEWSDEDVIEHLIPVRGIGRWTAEMFLIFSLGRLDVLPVNDLGLRVGVQRQYGLEKQPTKHALVELAEPWRPYRSIATWYFWRSFGPVPQSDAATKERLNAQPKGERAQ
jgi:DNA-3-methyladenine glycosylase II